MTGISENFESTVFHLIYVGLPFFSFQILHMSTSHVWIQMSNVEIIFPNEFQKFPLLVLAFTNESWEENSSDNYQVSQNLRKLVQRKFPS